MNKFFLILILTISCARKLPPLNPDIFAPEIEDYQIPNNYTIKIKFNENLNSKIEKEKFSLSSSKEILKIKEIFVENKFLTIITDQQKSINYLLTGEISDENNNHASFKLKFKGNPAPDTIKPFIKNITINEEQILISFSEPMIETNFRYLLSPALVSETIWQKDRKNLILKFKEKPKEFCSFLILPTLKDFGGNNLLNGEDKFQIFDAAIKFINLEGKVFLKETLVNNAVLVLKSENFLSLALSKKGLFKTKVKEGRYRITSLLDIDLDFYPNFYNQEATEVKKDTTISINLSPVKDKKRLDEYLY